MTTTNETLMAREIGTLTDIHRQGGNANTFGSLMGEYKTAFGFVTRSFSKHVVESLVSKGYLVRTESYAGYSVILSDKGIASMRRLGY